MPTDRSHAEALADIAVLFGLSRPAGQCFASIWRAAQPPCADDLVQTLGLSRSNVSTALKELREWGLIATARRLGDRKDYFTAPPDLWETVRMLAAGQARRRLRPILDRIQSEGAEPTDPRAADLRAVLRKVAQTLEELAALDIAALGAVMGEEPSHPPKKNKKKKKKGAGG
ncbi:hypothetical protein DEA8626_03580 [Defluviimonas aquaemixtae]|uniref:HTH-type transcriptional regulator n=1 Tax=Albidovulum aquaemixtae TaxID=1542388 RepID=A0A2R8BM75_9RHOB|nr:MarR family transcriptional regulator [Defluviimonas aquaemixtae]SPH24528.1 hypothetical protein DEA8626_03580 [Defluviimonas aquaemixtae]